MPAQLYEEIKRLGRYSIPLPPDPMKFMTPAESTSTPTFRTLDVELVAEEGDVVVLDVTYRSVKTRLAVLPWMCERDVLLSVAFRELRRSAERKTA